jgi:hypothetical protein
MCTKKLSPCEFQIPLRYNPERGERIGKAIEPEVLLEILVGLNRRFGGYTVLTPLDLERAAMGQWEDQEEPSARIEVSVLPERVEEVRQYVVEIGVRLKQKAMYFKVGPPCVEIIEIRKAAD